MRLGPSRERDSQKECGSSSPKPRSSTACTWDRWWTNHDPIPPTIGTTTGKETKAAALYLQDLYGTDAQASGFLVMACYNWGENQVLPLIRSMPANPRDRNFWKLLSKHRDKIPQETYDYVFYIASAAVIGENPRLFGFDFDNPLANPGKAP